MNSPSYFQNNIIVALFLSVTFLLSCTAPREMTLSGKVTPHKEIKAGANFSGNIPTQTIGTLYENVDDIANTLINQDSVVWDDQLKALNKSLLSYSLDPIGAGMSFYARYGVYKHVDVGYKYFGGTHVFDGMYQFMGSTGRVDDASADASRMYGSVGLQFSMQKFEIPSEMGLDKVQDILGFEISRKDLMIPLIFSNSFGPEEKYGCISYGLIYNHTFIKYGFEPSKYIYEVLDTLNVPLTIDGFSEKKNFGSMGAFLNLKVGYKYVFAVASFSTFYQNYGTYALINGESYSMKGFTFVPTIGLQAYIPVVTIAEAVRKKKG